VRGVIIMSMSREKVRKEKKVNWS